jgi:hypothetical protein
MATGKVSTFRTIYKGYITCLRAQGCVLCRGCYCYMPPEHACAAVEPLRRAA